MVFSVTRASLLRKASQLLGLYWRVPIRSTNWALACSFAAGSHIRDSSAATGRGCGLRALWQPTSAVAPQVGSRHLGTFSAAWAATLCRLARHLEQHQNLGTKRSKPLSAEFAANEDHRLHQRTKAVESSKASLLCAPGCLG